MREVRFSAGNLRSGRTGSGEEDYIAPRAVSACIAVRVAQAGPRSSFAGRARAGWSISRRTSTRNSSGALAISAAVSFSSTTVSRRSRSSRSSAPGASISGNMSAMRCARLRSARQVPAALSRNCRRCRRNPFRISRRKMRANLRAKKIPSASFARASDGSRARGGFLFFLRGFEHRVHAIGEAFQLPSAGGAARTRIAFKCAIDSFQHSGQGNAGLLPGLDNGPVERRNQKMRSALLPEIFLDLGEIIEVVKLGHRFGRVSRLALSAFATRQWEPAFFPARPRGYALPHDFVPRRCAVLRASETRR